MTDHIKKLIAIILAKAHDKRESAGYSGSHDDGGASRMEDQVKYYQYGVNGTLPPEWKQYEHELDPEYQTYLELKRKFGNR